MTSCSTVNCSRRRQQASVCFCCSTPQSRASCSMHRKGRREEQGANRPVEEGVRRRCFERFCRRCRRKRRGRHACEPTTSSLSRVGFPLFRRYFSAPLSSGASQPLASPFERSKKAPQGAFNWGRKKSTFSAGEKKRKENLAETRPRPSLSLSPLSTSPTSQPLDLPPLAHPRVLPDDEKEEANKKNKAK